MTLKVTVTEDVSTVSVSGDTTSINLTGEQTEISVVNPAATVTYNPTAPITATNVQDAIPQAYKMIGEVTNDFDLHVEHGNSFKIIEGGEYAEFSSYGGQGGWSAEINSSEQITLRNGNSVAALFNDGSMNLYDTLYAGWSGGYNDSFIETTSGLSSRKHISLKSGTARKGYMGISSVSMYIGSGETALGFSDYLGTKLIRPSVSVNQPSDASISLGASNARFKELYLSDNLYADGVEFENGAITFTTSAFNVKSQYSVTTISSDNNGVSLYFNGSEKFETTPNGVQVSGNITTQASGSNNGDITVSGTINANGVINADDIINVDDIQSDNIVNIDGDNGVILKHDGTTRISTSNSGVEIKGTTAGGTTVTNFIADGGSAIMKSSSSAFGKVTCSGTAVQISGFFQPLNGVQFDVFGSLLDDYEEGTFTPTFYFGTSNHNMVTYRDEGAYTKIGRFVVCTIFGKITTLGYSTGKVTVRNLPFTVGSTIGNTSRESVGFVSSVANTAIATNHLGLVALQGTTDAIFNYTDSSYAKNELFKDDISDGFEFKATLTYFVD